MFTPKPYSGWSHRSRVGQATIVVALSLFMLYILYRFNFYPWYFIGLVASSLVFAPILVVDREYQHSIALHHFPEASSLLFAGSIVGVWFHAWMFVLLLTPVVFFFFFDIVVLSLKIHKTQIVWGRLVRFLGVFTGIFAGGMVLGLLYA